MAKDDWVRGVRRVDKPWGHEEHFALVAGKFCGKTLHVSAGHSLSLQYHRRKEETVAVQSGRLRFEVAAPGAALEAFELLPGESVHLRPGVRHRLTAVEDTVVLEASTTELHDVVRLEDRYGRVDAVDVLDAVDAVDTVGAAAAWWGPLRRPASPASRRRAPRPLHPG